MKKIVFILVFALMGVLYAVNTVEAQNVVASKTIENSFTKQEVGNDTLPISGKEKTGSYSMGITKIKYKH